MAWLLLFFWLVLPVCAQVPQPVPPPAAIDQLFQNHRWQEVVEAVEKQGMSSPDSAYYYGVSLAQLHRWEAAHAALLSGYRQQPTGRRFPEDLAGVAFRQNRHTEATMWLHKVLRSAPGDEYANDFLGTIYFLDGNLEAALKYWNRVSRPRIQDVRSDPEPRLKPVLLDHAMAFSPASILRLQDLLASRARVGSLGVFRRYSFDLAAQDSGDFDVTFRSAERNGFGRTKLEGALNFFRGIFVQTVYPEYFNVGGTATNLLSSVRWDSERRRITASVSGPLHDTTTRHYRIGVDLRNENWDLRASSRGPAPVVSSLNLRKEGFTAGITSLVGAAWTWSTGVELSHRDFRNSIAGPALNPSLLSNGYQLKHTSAFTYELWRVPERRFLATTEGSSELARLWSSTPQTFGKLQGSLDINWLPQAQGNDYEVTGRLRLGGLFGSGPFDELFLLGLERDSDLRLRGHIGSRDGRKGSSPLTQSYFLSNWEVDKNIVATSLLRLRISPFLDTAKAFDPLPQPWPDRWLWDTGIQAKLNAYGVGLIFTYGRDLRSGAGVFFLSVGR